MGARASASSALASASSAMALAISALVAARRPSARSAASASATSRSSCWASTRQLPRPPPPPGGAGGKCQQLAPNSCGPPWMDGKLTFFIALNFWDVTRSDATTGITTSSSDDEFLHTDNFFPDLSDFFGNLNMGDNDAAVKQINSSSVAAATRPPLFDGMHYKRWRTKAVLWFTNLGCFSATDARPEGPLSAEEQEKFEKVDAMFKAALFSILGDNIVDPYMAFDHGKDAWDALEAKFGVSDAGTELYVMEQYYDYRMTDERSVVEQAHEIQSLAKELEQFKCTLPDKFVAEKARAKDTRARSFEGGSSANVVQKKNFQSHKSKNKNNGKGKFDEKNKASNSTNFKRKTPYKKKGNCHVCGAPGHWAPDCPERHDRRGNSGKSANVVIGVDTEMKDVGYGRKDFLRADGKRLTCFCSWCWYGGSEVYFGKDHPAEECAARSFH
ncbi:hypothetical protein QYE76_022862 [Lolium multiflorum]|uniref:CCHC-type domain-containing protein n=1 Tax=Lolium multiflorum TaxID=4521 RepID=A0AAD8VU69_LOLMU|nr:hypothetical protein QYE76_022862 [Lolium multiflorum]